MDIPILFAGLHTGLSSAISGPTHVVISDLTLIRTCERITAYNPSDCDICDLMFEDALQFRKPYYFRFDKDITYRLERKKMDFESGYSLINEGNDENKVLIATTGYHTKICSDIINAMPVKPALLDVFRIPCDKASLADEIRKYNKVVTIEEHILQGGFGSYILEIMADCGVCLPVKRIGIDIEK